MNKRGRTRKRIPWQRPVLIDLSKDMTAWGLCGSGSSPSGSAQCFSGSGEHPGGGSGIGIAGIRG